MKYSPFICAAVALVGCSKPADGIKVPDATQLKEMTATVVNTGLPTFPAGTYSIRQEDRSRILEFLVPGKRDDSGLSKKYEMVCIIDIVTIDNQHIRYYIRSVGDNPLIMSVDDQEYYWAQRPVKGGSDTAYALAAYVQKTGDKK